MLGLFVRAHENIHQSLCDFNIIFFLSHSRYIIEQRVISLCKYFFISLIRLIWTLICSKSLCALASHRENILAGSLNNYYSLKDFRSFK